MKEGATELGGLEDLESRFCKDANDVSVWFTSTEKPPPKRRYQVLKASHVGVLRAEVLEEAESAPGLQDPVNLSGSRWSIRDGGKYQGGDNGVKALVRERQSLTLGLNKPDRDMRHSRSIAGPPDHIRIWVNPYNNPGLPIEGKVQARADT